MKRKRRNHSPEFKARVGLEALKGQQTVANLARKFEVHVSQVTSWKGTIREGISGLFEAQNGDDFRHREQELQDLRAKIGELTMELDWLKKNRHRHPSERTVKMDRNFRL
jgi:transposase